MSGCSSQSVARLFAVTLVGVLVACSGDSGGGGEKAAPKSSPSTTAPPATIDLSTPIPGGSLHGTPRPPLENTGSDYVAIFKSLDAGIRWLTENPDPSLVSDIYVPGTAEHDERCAALSGSSSTSGGDAADEGYRLLSVDVVDAQPQTVVPAGRRPIRRERVVDAIRTTSW